MTLMERYAKVWMDRDHKGFLEMLDDCVHVKECTGDTYNGKDVCRLWFEGWHEGGNRVIDWQVVNEWQLGENSFSCWRFTCLYQGKEYTFDGMSHFRLNGDRIIELNEYSQETDSKYPYGGPK